jgi:hypothetical protein
VKASWSVIVPYVETGRTEWHPDKPEGPFSSLVRGNFARVTDAIKWAWEKIPGSPYKLRYNPAWCDRCGEDLTEIDAKEWNSKVCAACYDILAKKEAAHAV